MYTASYMIIVHSNQLFSFRVYLNKNELHRGLKITLRVFNNKTSKLTEWNLNTLKWRVIFAVLNFPRKSCFNKHLCPTFWCLFAVKSSVLLFWHYIFFSMIHSFTSAFCYNHLVLRNRGHHAVFEAPDCKNICWLISCLNHSLKVTADLKHLNCLSHVLLWKTSRIIILLVASFNFLTVFRRCDRTVLVRNRPELVKILVQEFSQSKYLSLCLLLSLPLTLFLSFFYQSHLSLVPRLRRNRGTSGPLVREWSWEVFAKAGVARSRIKCTFRNDYWSVSEPYSFHLFSYTRQRLP